MSAASANLHLVGEVAAVRDLGQDKLSFAVVAHEYDPGSKTKENKIVRVDVYVGGKLSDTLRSIAKGSVISCYGEAGVYTGKDGSGILHMQDALVHCVSAQNLAPSPPVLSVAGVLGKPAREVGEAKVGLSIAVSNFDREKKEKGTLWIDALCYVGKSRDNLVKYLTKSSSVFVVGEAYVKTYEGNHSLALSGRHLSLLRSGRSEDPDFSNVDPHAVSPTPSSVAPVMPSDLLDDDDIPF